MIDMHIPDRRLAVGCVLQSMHASPTEFTYVVVGWFYQGIASGLKYLDLR
jgi:hypothetical protein